MWSNTHGDTHSALSNKISDPNDAKPQCCTHIRSNSGTQCSSYTNTYHKDADTAIGISSANYKPLERVTNFLRTHTVPHRDLL